MTKSTYWTDPAPDLDDFGTPIGTVFYDAPTRMGPWATMAHESWQQYRRSPKLGTGFGQKYRKQDDGRWFCVEGGITHAVTLSAQDQAQITAEARERKRG